jgi:hypothetical protein
MFVLFVGLFGRVAAVVLHDWTSVHPFSELASVVGVGDSSQGAWNFTSKCVLTDSTSAQVLFTTPSPPPAFNVSMRATLDIRFPDPAAHHDGIYVVFGSIAGVLMRNTPGRMKVFMFTSPNITIFDPDDSAGAVEDVSNVVLFNETTSNEIRFVVEWLAGNVDFVNVTAFFVSEKAVANATIMSFVQRLPQRAGKPAFVPSVTASPFMLTTRWNVRFCMRAWRVETLESLPASTTSSSPLSTAAQTGSTASTSALTSESTRSATETFAASTGLGGTSSATTSLLTTTSLSMTTSDSSAPTSAASTPSSTPEIVMTSESMLANVTTVVVTTPSSEDPAPWIIGVIIGGAVFVIVVAGLAIYFLLKRRRAQQPRAENVELKQPSLGVGSRVVGAGKSEYGGLLFVPQDAAIAGNYAQHASNYAAKPKSSEYAANAAEFKAGILQESNYGLIRDTDHYAKSTAEFKVGVSQEPNYAEINDNDADLK